MIANPDRPVIRDNAAPAGGIFPSAGVAVERAEQRLGGLHLGVTAVVCTLGIAGVDLANGAATMIWCGVILLLGLPHGALDLVRLLAAGRPARGIAHYLALAGAMAGLWWAMPGGALLLFFGVAVGHFGEDWPGSGLIANGGALSLMAAPLLLHRGEIDSLFAIIAGQGAIPPLSTALLLVAPVAIAAALVGCVLLWNEGRQMLAASSAAAIGGMLVLPPLAGFALAFGLFHSPRQFARSVEELGEQQWRGPVAAASLVSLLLVGVVGWLGSSSVSAGVLRGTFIVLSVLTVPHMMMPHILRSARAGGRDFPAVVDAG